MHNFDFGTKFTVNAEVPAFTASGKPLSEKSLVFEWSDTQVDVESPAFTFVQDATDPSIITVTIADEPTAEDVNDLQGTIVLNVRNKKGELLGNGSEGIGASAVATSIGNITLSFSTDPTPTP